MLQIRAKGVWDETKLQGKVINWELCKKVKFDRTKKWYIYNPESIQENSMHNVLLDLEIKQII